MGSDCRDCFSIRIRIRVTGSLSSRVRSAALPDLPLRKATRLGAYAVKRQRMEPGGVVLSRIIVGALLPLLATISSAQQTAQPILLNRVSCATCSVETRVVLTLGTKDGASALPGVPRDVTVDSQGRFWTVFLRRAPLLFARDGFFLREVGRLGEGPGEFVMPWNLLPVGDSMAVFGLQGHVTVVGPNLNHVRTSTGPPMRGLTSVDLVRWPDEVLVAALTAQPAVAGQPLHLMDYAGGVARTVRSFGGTAEMPRNDPALLSQGGASWTMRLQRAVATSGEALFAVSRYTEYLVTQWDKTGKVIMQLDRAADFFPKKDIFIVGSSVRAPDTRMVAAWHDSRRYLWTFGHVAAPNWQQIQRAWTAENPPPPPPTGGAGTIRAESSGRSIPESSLYHTFIEVIDLESRTVVSSGRYAGFVVAVLPDGRLVSYRETDDGIPYLDIVQVSLRGVR